MILFSTFLINTQAEAEDLLTATIHIDMKSSTGGQTYFEEIKQLYYRVNIVLIITLNRHVMNNVHSRMNSVTWYRNGTNKEAK